MADMIYQNHLVDPTYFYDAIEEFSFSFTIYTVTNKTIDDYGNVKYTYDNAIIRGSLQSDGTRLVQSQEGNTTVVKYRFYCKSLYRINIGDIIEYKNKYLRVDFVQDYDEYGVRNCELTMIQLTAYRDLRDYIRYLNGEVLV